MQPGSGRLGERTDPRSATFLRSVRAQLQVLREFLARQRAAGRAYGRVVYVGDGRGDYCPTVELLHSGLPSLVLARSQYPDGVPCALWVKLRGEVDGGSGGGGAAAAAGSAKQEVREWQTPEELAGHLRALLGELGT